MILLMSSNWTRFKCRVSKFNLKVLARSLSWRMKLENRVSFSSKIFLWSKNTNFTFIRKARKVRSLKESLLTRKASCLFKAPSTSSMARRDLWLWDLKFKTKLLRSRSIWSETAKWTKVSGIQIWSWSHSEDQSFLVHHSLKRQVSSQLKAWEQGSKEIRSSKS